MKRDANDVENLTEETSSRLKQAEENMQANSGWLNISQLSTDYPELRNFVIQGIIREGEVMNIIAPPKSGKSILAANIAYHVAAGRPIFHHDWQTCGGEIAIIDTELHKETISHRMNLVLKELKFDPELKSKVHVFPLRGKQMSLFELAENLIVLKQKKIKLIIIDCLYKLLPKGVDENSNSDMIQIYNYLDSIMHILPGSAMMLIHHSSKGSQFSKSVSDVGSGAGVQSRATDCHMILREHEQDEHFIIDAITRSFKRTQPFVIKYEYPLYKLCDGMSAEDYKGSKKIGSKNDKYEITNDEFIIILTDSWHSKKQIISDLRNQYSVSYKAAELLLENIVAKFGLESLTSQDGEKICDGFICSNIKGLKFKKGDSNESENSQRNDTGF